MTSVILEFIQSLKWSEIMKAFMLFVFAGLSVLGSAIAGTEAEESAIAHVIEQFKVSGDQQNPKLAEPILHEDFTLFYRVPEGWVATSKSDYMSALTAKVIGGVERSSTVDGVIISGGVATAHVLFESSAASFEQFVNLIKTGEGWQIVSIALNFRPKG